MRETKNVLIIAGCILLSVFGIYFQFFKKDAREKEPYVSKKRQEIDLTEEVPDGNQQIPVDEELLEAQTFGEGDSLTVYYTNMDKIQEDASYLPYQAYADLVPETVTFLENQTELELPNETIELSLNEEMIYRKNNLISFHCFFAEIPTDLELEYVYDDIEMRYIDLHFVPKGEWKLAWKNE